MIAAERSLSFGSPDDGDPNVIPLTDTAPALVASFALTPAIFSSKETVDDVLAAIRAEADKFIEVRDISTPAGRAAIASFAHSKIAKSKTALDELGKTVKDEAQQKVFTVDAERRRIRDFLDALRDEVRKPLTDWETADKVRIQNHENALVAMRCLTEFSMFEPTTEIIGHRIRELGPLVGRNWEEFADRAGRMSSAVADELNRMLAEAGRRDRERLAREEAERLQQERERQEREERIAREAAEQARREESIRVALAEQQRREAERRAQEAEEARQRMAEARERNRKESQESAIAHMKALQTMDAARPSVHFTAALENLKLFYETREWHEYDVSAAEAYDMSVASLEDKRRNALAREEQERKDREAAIVTRARLEEQQRQAAAAAAEEEARAKRESNKRIRNRVRRQIAEAIVRVAGDQIAFATTTDGVAELVADALIDGKIPHVTVTF